MRFVRFLLLSLGLLLAVAAPASARHDGARAVAISIAPAFTPAEQYAYAGENWLTAAGGITDDRYSTLNQINASNVANLTTAWHINLGYKPSPGESAEGNAVVYKGVMYLPTGLDKIYALDAATGQQIWYHQDVEPAGLNFLLRINRGVGIGDGRVYVGQLDGRVVALDQMTGGVLWSTKLGRAEEGYALTAPTVYYNGKVIVGMSGGDWGARSFAAALDAKTGKELWRWYTVPSPGELGGGSWQPGDWLKGGGAIWISSSVDPSTGLVYFVTGNPVPYAGRGPGDNLFTDSIVALHIEDGTMAWWFQTVHHDNWDYDVTNPPVLFDTTINGTMAHGIATASKTGWVYILDRTTGKPLVGINETKVPQQKYWANTAATQPIPVGDAFVRQCAKRSEYKKLAPDGKPFRIGCVFTPYAPTKNYSYLGRAPSTSGGVDWPPSSYNPSTHFEYVCATDGPGSALGAVPVKQQRWIPGDVFAVVGIHFGSAKAPQYGNITAMDVTTNKIAWQHKGAADGWPTPCYSGSLTTAGNLTFVGHSEGILTAYAADSGQKLWDSPKLEGGANAPSVTYLAGGKQYVSIFAGGAGAGKQSDAVYTFTLP